MADNLDILGKEVIIGGSEHIRDSDIEEALAEGDIFVGDALNKGTAETQVVAGIEAATNFKGIALGHSIRQSDLETVGTAGDRTDAIALGTGAGGLLVAGKYIKYLKPMGGRVKVRVMISGYDTGATIPSGSPVYYASTGSTITQTGMKGQFFCDPAQEGDAVEVGRLSKAVVCADTTTNLENAEAEMWY